MLQMQKTMNEKVNPDWKNKGWSFLRAAMVEGVEAMEHRGWKWWKKQTCDLPQLQMEYVDIWHFALSDLMLNNPEKSLEEIAEIVSMQIGAKNDLVVADGQSFIISKMNELEKMDIMIGLAAFKRFSIPLFESLMKDAELDWNILYRQYVGKNALNIFRQNNGYAAGHYIKIWQGREDNEHLQEIVNELSWEESNPFIILTQKLEERYHALNI